MFLNVFKIATVAIVSFLVEESFPMISQDRYSSAEEYLENCRRFSEPFPVKKIPEPTILAKSGFNFNNVLIITANSIINGVFKDNSTRKAYFLTLPKSENIHLLLAEFQNFLDQSVFPKENEAAYKQYVSQTVSGGFDARKHRENVVSFLAALEYRKTIVPTFQVIFERNRYEEIFYGDALFLNLEFADGKHYEESLNNTKMTFTLPCLKHNPRACSCRGATFTDTYVSGHELGHATHDLLGINAPRTSFNMYINNNFIRNIFFPLIDRTSKNIDSLLPRLQSEVNQAIASGECTNETEYFSKKLNDKKKLYDQMEWLYGDNESEISGIASLQRSIDTKSFNEDFLKNAIRMEMKYRAFEMWTRPEELFQISGISFCNGYTIVNCLSDLDLFATSSVLLRWWHICSDSEIVRCKTNTFEFKNLFPSMEYVEGLLFLHGYDFNRYKSATNARLFSVDYCWISPYESLTQALKKMCEMNNAVLYYLSNISSLASESRIPGVSSI
jgi:hypothetical protein